MANGTIKAVPADDEVVHNTGTEDAYEEITGAKWFQTRYFATGKSSVSRYHGLYFQHDDTFLNLNGSISMDAGNSTNQTLNRISCYEYSPKTTPDEGNTGYYEAYRFPSPTAGRTSNGDYSILTSKNPESVRSTLGLGNEALLKDCIIYQSAAKGHTFTVPNGSRNLIIACGDGVTRALVGFVYGGSTGTITFTEIIQGSNVASVTTDTNSITITLTTSQGLYLQCINVRGDTLSNSAT